MALEDQNLVLGSAQAVTASAPTTNTYDILQGLPLNSSSGTYTVPPSYIIGNATYFGEDLGHGRGVGTPAFEFFSGTGTPGGATSLQIAVQGAPDNGGGTISGLTFTAYIETGAILLASILASIRLASMDWPRRQVNLGLPRFVQGYFNVVGSNFSGLTISSYINLGGSSSQNTLGLYPSNY
jgi:hypothetical protein